MRSAGRTGLRDWLQRSWGELAAALEVEFEFGPQRSRLH